MRKPILIVLGLTCLFFTSNAQEVFKGNSFGGGFNFHVGYQAFDVDQYFGTNPQFQMAERTKIDGVTPNQTISRATYAKPSTGLLAFGFQGYGAFNSIIMGGELTAGLGSAKTSLQYDTVFVNSSRSELTASNSARVVAANVLYNIGYVALRKRGLIAYPMLGIGYGASGLWLKSGSDEQRVYPTATDVITDKNLQNMMIWTTNVIFDMGVGVQYMFGASTEDRAKGFSLGLRLGYQTQLATDNIRVNFNKKAADSFANPSLPKLGNSGFYAKLLIGFGKIGESR